MKRHEALVPLSHDHHQALRLAQALKKNGAPTKRGMQSPEEKLQDAKRTYELELIDHFRHEEEIVFPLAKGRDAEMDAMIKDILNQHKKITEAINSLENGNLVENLDKLGQMLVDHIRQEEREVFPKVE
ncbi:MAG: hemerythrin domain-containing protein, partial [Chlorobi bacterium]|nr:hemerythrin domain-containing protein [Chlorobiota bacterium]